MTKKRMPNDVATCVDFSSQSKPSFFCTRGSM